MPSKAITIPSSYIVLYIEELATLNPSLLYLLDLNQLAKYAAYLLTQPSTILCGSLAVYVTQFINSLKDRIVLTQLLMPLNKLMCNFDMSC